MGAGGGACASPGRKMSPEERASGGTGGTGVRRAVRWDCVGGGDRRRHGEPGVLGCGEQQLGCQETGCSSQDFVIERVEAHSAGPTEALKR